MENTESKPEAEHPDPVKTRNNREKNSQGYSNLYPSWRKYVKL